MTGWNRLQQKIQTKLMVKNGKSEKLRVKLKVHGFITDLQSVYNAIVVVLPLSWTCLTVCLQIFASVRRDRCLCFGMLSQSNLESEYRNIETKKIETISVFEMLQAQHYPGVFLLSRSVTQFFRSS